VLGHETGGTCRQYRPDIARRVVRRHHDQRNGRRAGGQFSHRTRAAHAGHAQVEQGQVGIGMRRQRGPGAGEIGGLDNLQPGIEPREYLRQSGTDHRMVVGENQFHCMLQIRWS